MTTKARHDYRHHVLIPVLLACFSYALYSGGDAAMKTMAGKFHFSQIFFINSLITLFYMSTYGWIKERKKAFRTKKPWMMLFRALSAQAPGICNVYALPHLEMTSFYTLAFTSPLWLALMAALFLKDKLGGRRLGVILFGFLVVLFILRPGSSLFNLWSFLVLFGAFSYAGQMVLIRSIGPHESRPFMIMCGAATSILISLPFLQAHWVTPDPRDWLIFFGMTSLGCVGILCMTYAFQVARSAALVAPTHYTQIIWGAITGYYIYNETPRLEVMVGAVLIMLSGIYLIHHEHRKSLLKPPPQEIP